MNTPSESTKRRLVAIVASALLLVSACGQGGGASSPPASVEASIEASATPPAAAGGAGTITVATDPKLGAILVGEGGRTLYLFTKDTGGKSVCNDDCATNWPPLLVAAGAQLAPGAGVTGTIGSVVRDDGTTQVTYRGAPLYYFAGDKGPGETSGQGLSGVWFVATPSGASGAAKGSY